MGPPSDWFIAERVRRLQRLVGSMPARPPGIARSELAKELSPSIDGPRHEIPQLVDVLAQLKLLHVTGGRFQLSRQGHRVATMSGERATRELGQLIMQSGFLHDQVRQLIEASTLDGEDSYRSEVRLLRHSAPQLLGLLRGWPNIVGASYVTIPRDLFDLIDAPWSLVPVPAPSDEAAKAIGSRGEAYSVRLLRLSSQRPTAVVWVARDDETLGYDIEDHSTGASQRIEVKASQRGDVRFFLSAHEYHVAHEDPSSYEIHFWGEIDLNRDPNTDFSALRQRGFPLRFPDLAAHLADGRLDAVPTKYRVTLGCPSG